VINIKIEVLMSACKVNSIKDIIKFKNINNGIIINQLMDNEREEKYKNITMYNSKDKGLSKSRNMLLKKMNGDIGIITDDDITFVKNYEEIISNAYTKHPDADIIIFNVQFGSRVHGKSEYHKYSKITILGVMSVQITFRQKSIKDNNIKFNENFGLKAKFGSGEENIFLSDALNSGLKIVHEPVILCNHPEIETTGEKWNEDTIKTKGAVSYKLLGKMHNIFKYYLLITKYNLYKEDFNMREFLKLYNLGLKEYKKIEV